MYLSAMADVPNIAVGDVFGGCVFNLAILIVPDRMLWRIPSRDAPNAKQPGQEEP